jgi:glucosamine--fructose-6-phosphate aminotransferase (isomerizing)
MCGIFDVASGSAVSLNGPRSRACVAEQRGKDSSGLRIPRIDRYRLIRSGSSITRLLEKVNLGTPGHVIDNGIVVNDAEIWSTSGSEPCQGVDSEAMAAIAAIILDEVGAVEDTAGGVFEPCEGPVAVALVIPSLGELSVCPNSRHEALALVNGEHLPRYLNINANLDSPGVMCSPIPNVDPQDLLAADRWFTHA